MIKIEIFSKDFIWDNFRASDHGLTVASFSYSGTSEDDIGMTVNTSEEFIGGYPIPVYLGDKYTDKLNLQITLIKDPCTFQNDMFFTEKDCRWLLRELTGKKGYQWTKIVTYDSEEDLWYRTKVKSVAYNRVGNRIAGLIFEFECDSFYAWSTEQNITIHATANRPFYIFNNTDDLNNYVYPVVSIIPSSAGTISLTNKNDNEYLSEIKNVNQNEKITIDSQHQIISSNSLHDLLLDDFNLKWIRLVPDKNEYVSNIDIIVSMKYRVPRKVGVVG